MAGTERKLTTILAIDVVGFSEMMGRNESRTLDNLKDCRAIVEASIEQHNGRVFGGAGDSLITEFSSPLQAVVCANDFQQSIAERNQERPEDDRMWFRVGINLGDVMVDGDNLYGDGVNIAARLEQIGEPGGVCVSHKVFEEVRRNLGLPFVDGGIRELKNISEPVAVHHVRPVTDDRSGKTGTEAGQSRAPPNRAVPPRTVPSAPEQHSIIVHPFKVTGDDETEFLAEGLRDGLSGILSKSSAVKLVADAEHGRMRPDFILEGNVRGRGDEQAPEMDRNKLVHAALLWHADQQEKAVAVAAWLKEKYPALTGGTMRPVQFGASDAAVRFNQAFRDMGFEPADNVVSIGKR